MPMDTRVVPTLVYKNDAVLPRAFFVDSVNRRNRHSEHIKNNDFNPASAFVEESLPKAIDTITGGDCKSRRTEK